MRHDVTVARRLKTPVNHQRSFPRSRAWAGPVSAAAILGMRARPTSKYAYE